MTTLEEVFIKANEAVEGNPDEENIDHDELMRNVGQARE